jgi:hypothetical protein
MLLEFAILFGWSVYFFETYLDYRQHRKLYEKDIPKELDGVVRFV